MTTNETQQQFAQRQVERQTYNENSWQHRQGQSEQQPAFTPPQERTPLLTTTGEVEPVTAEDPFHLQPEEHVERDAWHSIVVDKYGREDVSARQQYGKAFEQEQREVRKSALSDDTPTSKDGRDTVNTPSANSPTPTLLPTTPLSQQPMQSRSNPADQMLPAGLTQPQLPIGPPVRGDSQHLLPAHVKTGVSVLLNPWVWLFVGLLILVFFGASLFG